MLRLLPRKRRSRLGLVGVTVAAVLLAMGVHAGGWGQRPVDQKDLLAWHSRLVETPQPSVRGCFDATYPEAAWRETACVDPPAVHMSPNRLPAAPRDIGNGKSVVAERSPGTDDITHARGSFEEIDEAEANALTVQSSPSSGPAPVMADSYSLQINTNRLKVTECAAAPIPTDCEGWKQFIFANDGTGPRGPNDTPSSLYMQYWLLGFNPDASRGKPCPRGWLPVAEEGVVHCSLKTPAQAVPYVPIKNIGLEGFKLEAMTQTVAGILVDILVFSYGEEDFVSVASTEAPHVVPEAVEPNQAGPGWTQVEFNVFGYGNGATAVFNKEANFNVRTTIVNGSPVRPRCQDYGYSGEKNNLNFGIRPTLFPTSPAPALLFNQAQQARTPTGCAAAVAIGDTHQYTYGRTFYDFQATGDFVEARAGSTFEVQTRKKSGAPRWPNASVTHSVGVRMGTTRLAVCAGTRLVVNGADTNLPSGESLLLPTGVTIDRVGNVYTFRDASGNAVRTTAINGNVPYIDLGVGLGPDTPAVRGLLGNHNGDPDYLEASNGDAMRVPLSFDDLYNVYGDSWRVSPTASLLRFCEPVAVANPAAPFFAWDLPAELRQSAREHCSRLLIDEAWNIPCELDFAVLGPESSDTYLGLQPPAKNGNPEPPPSPSPTGGNSACRITYTSTSNSANAGFTGNVIITNTGNTPVNGWTLTFSFTNGQQVTTGWNATVTQLANMVTARNLSYNATIAPGASTSFGFLGTRGGSSANPPPVGWTLNGTACTT